MSRSHPTHVETEELRFDCHLCGATAGAWCTTKSGVFTGYLHGDRWWQWHAIRRQEMTNERSNHAST